MGYVFGLLSALLFGANGSVAKLVMQGGVDPAALTFFRCLGAALLSGAFVLAMDRRSLRVSRRTLLGCALLGVIGVAAMQWLYAVAIDRLPVGIALLLEYLGVPLVAVVAWLFLSEPVRARLWGAIALVIGGLAVVAQVGAAQLDALGIVAALGAAAALAAYFLLGERGVADAPPMVVAFWSMLFAALFWAVPSRWWEVPPSVLTTSVETGAGPAAPVWLGLAWVIVLGSFAPYLLSYLAIKRLGATRSGILAAAEVVFAFAIAWLWLGESLTPAQAAGAGLVLAGILLAQTSRPRVATPIEADLALVPSADVGGRS
ncbi:DMT family transporter [Naasia sp. SYSU D00948]|uniref:DMT family transporter n=1 Tax=Naasia sp. SYSU D00948 TaxID=2817379 RepID=UPI001B3062A5|nr:DMT family transporter [Naasia sp. SYSU D00948]